MIENKNRTELATAGDATNNSMSTQRARPAPDISTNQQISVSENKSLGGNALLDHRVEMCRSDNSQHLEQPSGRQPLNEGDKNSLQNSPKTTLRPASNGSLKRDLNAPGTHGNNTPMSIEGNLNGRRDSVNEECGPAKRPRLDSRMSSLENELDNSSSIPSRTGSPTPLVNGDIKGDPRNKLMDKLLDKDLHLPLNGVCGIDTSELDLLASDGERLSSSKASSPDLFGSETNSDFGKYLEESDTDTGLFSDVLQGDLRIDPMENGTDGTHPVSSKMPTFPGGSFNEGRNTSNEKGLSAGVTEQQGKIPIPPAVRPDPLPGQYNVTAVRDPVAVTEVSKAGFGQRFGTEVQQKMPFYPQQGTLPPPLGNRPQMPNVNMENKRQVDPQASSVTMQKQTILPHQNIQPNPQQMITAHDSSSAIHPSVVPKNTIPRPQGTEFVNSVIPGSQGAGLQQSLPASPFLGGQQMPSAGQQMPSAQTSLPRMNAGIQSGWAKGGLQQQQVSFSPGAQPMLQQKAGPAGFQAGMRHSLPSGSQASTGPSGPQSMSSSSGWQPQMQQPPKSVNAYPETRTQSVANPSTGVYEAASAAQNRQPPLAAQFQHPTLPTAGKNAVQNPVVSIPVNPSGSQEFPSTPPSQGNHMVESAVPVSFKPYRCRWTTCYR